MRSAVLSGPLILYQLVCLCFGHEEIGVISDLETAYRVTKTFDTQQEIPNFISMHYFLERTCVRLRKENHLSWLKYPVFPHESM